MCLIAFSVLPDDEHLLLLAGNRDEFHARPTEALRRWRDKPSIVGGRDLQAGGTWLAAGLDGRFATVTNSRDARAPDPAFRSRGLLVTEFLDSTAPPLEYLEGLELDRYAGFNLIVSDGKSVAYGSNRGEALRQLQPGTYAVSNAVLDTPWHKVRYAKTALESLLDGRRGSDDELFRLLASRDRAPASAVEDSELPFDLAHAITAPFIVRPEYGTRASTLVRMRHDGRVAIVERQFDADGAMLSENREDYAASDE